METVLPKTSKIRIFADVELEKGNKVELSPEQSHYLVSVMRLQSGDNILVFNGKDGEFDCTLSVQGKKSVVIDINEQTKVFESVPDAWLLFAPLKKDCTDFVIEKATELGIAKIVPVITKYSISDKVKTSRYQSQAIEAAEQCRRLDVPTIDEAMSFEKLLNSWDEKRTLYYMDETLAGQPVSEAFGNAPAPVAFLIGPEGGFSEQELAVLRSKKYAKGVKLGNRILRAETAALSAISCWQALSGDWK